MHLSFHPFGHSDPWHKRYRPLLISLAVIALVGLAVAIGVYWPGRASIEQNENKNQGLLQQFGELRDAVGLIPRILGYDRPQTYLVLFLNNTEIRPGGGFIGSYALVKVDKGKVMEFETKGSENLDFAAPKDFVVEPPAPLKTYLKVLHWYFRDSNWSPDFPASSKQAIWFYRWEGGKDGDKIDGIIGITPRVVEELMKYTGPLTVNGRTFDAETFTNELEYHVELGYQEAGMAKSERKAILGDLGREFLKKLESVSPWQWKNIWSLGLSLLAERQIMIYSNYEDVQGLLVKNNWAGEVKPVAGDYLLVVDSNLASLKSDPAVKRLISYTVRREGSRLRAKAVITYTHEGGFDWKTTRYRTYTRIYTPAGIELVKAEGFIDKDKKSVPAEINSDLGKTVLGGFISIEPKETKTLTLEYYLPETVTKQVADGMYTLFVQKQLGTLNHQLTVDLDFGKKIKQTDKNQYQSKTDLSVDRVFKLEF